MAAPSTIAATGYFLASRAGVPAGEATLRMKNATRGTFALGGLEWKLTGDPAAKKCGGGRLGSVVDLKIINRSHLKGTVDGDALELLRAILRPISTTEMAQSDSGPTDRKSKVSDSRT